MHGWLYNKHTAIPPQLPKFQEMDIIQCTVYTQDTYTMIHNWFSFNDAIYLSKSPFLKLGFLLLANVSSVLKYVPSSNSYLDMDIIMKSENSPSSLHVSYVSWYWNKFMCKRELLSEMRSKSNMWSARGKLIETWKSHLEWPFEERGRNTCQHGTS